MSREGGSPGGRYPGAKDLPLYIATPSCDDDDNVTRCRSAIDHTTTKRTSKVIDSALLATLERLHLGDEAPAGWKAAA